MGYFRSVIEERAFVTLRSDVDEHKTSYKTERIRDTRSQCNPYVFVFFRSYDKSVSLYICIIRSISLRHHKVVHPYGSLTLFYGAKVVHLYRSVVFLCGITEWFVRSSPLAQNYTR